MRFLKTKRDVVDFVHGLSRDEAKVLLDILDKRGVIDDLIIYRLDQEDEKRKRYVEANGMTMREYWRSIGVFK